MAELLSFWQSIREYQLDYSKEQELHQTIADLSDYIKGLSTNSPEKYQEAMQMGVDIMNKYIDISSLSNRALKALIAENGYQYITDLLELEVGHLRNLVYFLPIIHALKGTIPGLVVVLSCFSDKVVIKEWWEDETRKMKRYTFNITVLRIRNMVFPKDLTTKIFRFCAEYVYPILAQLEIQITYADSDTNRLFAYCELKNQVVAIPDFSKYFLKLRSAIQAEYKPDTDEPVVISDEPYCIEWSDTYLNYLFKYKNTVVNFAETSATDLSEFKLYKIAEEPEPEPEPEIDPESDPGIDPESDPELDNLDDEESGLSEDSESEEQPGSNIEPELLLYYFWGPAESYNPESGAIYKGLLTESTVNEQINLLKNSISTIMSN